MPEPSIKEHMEVTREAYSGSLGATVGEIDRDILVKRARARLPSQSAR